MKRLSLTLLALCMGTAVWACPVCQRNQPKVLQNITHGQGPQSNWDYVIVCLIGAVAVFTLWYSVRWLIRPGEKNTGHIKYFILNPDKHES